MPNVLIPSKLLHKAVLLLVVNPLLSAKYPTASHKLLPKVDGLLMVVVLKVDGLLVVVALKADGLLAVVILKVDGLLVVVALKVGLLVLMVHLTKVIVNGIFSLCNALTAFKLLSLAVLPLVVVPKALLVPHKAVSLLLATDPLLSGKYLTASHKLLPLLAVLMAPPLLAVLLKVVVPKVDILLVVVAPKTALLVLVVYLMKVKVDDIFGLLDILTASSSSHWRSPRRWSPPCQPNSRRPATSSS